MGDDVIHGQALLTHGVMATRVERVAVFASNDLHIGRSSKCTGVAGFSETHMSHGGVDAAAAAAAAAADVDDDDDDDSPEHCPYT